MQAKLLGQCYDLDKKQNRKKVGKEYEKGTSMRRYLINNKENDKWSTFDPINHLINKRMHSISNL